MLYRPARVTPVGDTAVLDSIAFINGGDSALRTRPSLAQAFEVNATGARFVVDTNHFKSKGSACDAPDAGDGQGNCNAVRVAAATELAAWLATDPTGAGDADVLLIGDYNSYAKEDPIDILLGAGFTNLVSTFLGPDAYSYVFDGQWGYLDQALGSATIVDQVTGVADVHINADEPSVLDYNTDFKTSNLQDVLYAPDRFRVSDHDPVVIGLAAMAFDFSGFYAPIHSAGTNSANAGATVPVKFDLAGDQGLDIFAAGSPTSTQVDCTSGLAAAGAEATSTSGASGLQYDATTGAYTYAWKTSKAWAGTCRELTVTLVDGSIHTALFSFTK
jgi:hypothetical protein